MIHIFATIDTDGKPKIKVLEDDEQAKSYMRSLDMFNIE